VKHTYAMETDRRVKVALVSIGCNIALVAIKLFGARLSQSMGMQADAIHSLSDVFVSLLVLVGVLFSKEHPRWLRTIENTMALLISSLIMGAAVALLIRSRGYPVYTLQRVPTAVGFIWVCILMSLAVGRYKIRAGRECGSPSLEADGYHSMMDSLSSVAVLVGLVGSLVGFQLDSWASVVVALLVFKVGFEVMVAAIQGLGKSDVSAFETLAYARGTAFGAKVSGVCAPLFARFPQVQQCGQDIGATLWRRRRRIVSAAIVIALAGYAGSGFFRIQPNEVGVVLWTGKLVDGNVTPGLHWRPPWPFGTLYRERADEVRLLELGFRTVASRTDVEEPTAYLWESRHRAGIYEKVESEAVMLSGDKNEVDVNLALGYRIAPEKAAQFLFQLADSEATVRAAAESCTRRVVGIMVLDEVLTTARDDIEERIHALLQPLLDSYGAGVEVVSVQLQEIHPPVAVVPAFRQVATARENKVTMVNRAVGDHKEMIPKARGLAEYILSDAKAHRDEKKLEAEGDAAYFAAVAGAFQHSPAAVTFVEYMNTVEEVLPGLRKVLYTPEVKAAAGDNPLQTWFMRGEFLKKAFGTLGGFDGGLMSEEGPFIVDEPEERLP